MNASESEQLLNEARNRLASVLLDTEAESVRLAEVLVLDALVGIGQALVVIADRLDRVGDLLAR